MTDRVPARNTYLHSLDLLRGFAALSVLLYHSGFMFTAEFHVMPGGYLCVDIFFLLSGFVIARTYDFRIATGMTMGAFCIQRLARLYPLFFATTLAGFAVVLAKFYGQMHVFDGARAFLALLGSLFLVPNFIYPYGIDSLFPFNGAAWSIFFEFYVNVLFFLIWPYLSTRRLAAIVGTSLVLLVAAAMRAQSLDIGDKTADLVAAVPRVSFSFFLGVLISRLPLDGARYRGIWPLSLGLGAVLAATCMRGLIPAPLVWLWDVFAVVFIFPAVLVAFVRVQLTGRRASVAGFAGNVSYSVYLLQTPMIVVYSGLPQVFLGEKIATMVPWAGAILVPIVVATAYAVWRYYEVPAKQAVRQWHANVLEVLSRAA